MNLTYELNFRFKIVRHIKNRPPGVAMENKRILRGGHWKRGFHEPAATERSEGPKGFETCEGRRRRWLPELPRKPKGSEACEARPRPERSGGLPACGARGETNAAPEAKRAGSPSCVARPIGLAKLRNKTRRGFWHWAKEAVGLWSREGRPQGCRSVRKKHNPPFPAQRHNCSPGFAYL